LEDSSSKLREDLTAARTANDRLSRGLLATQHQAKEAALVRDDVQRELATVKPLCDESTRKLGEATSQLEAARRKAAGLEVALEAASAELSSMGSLHGESLDGLRRRVSEAARAREETRAMLVDSEEKLTKLAKDHELLTSRHGDLTSSHADLLESFGALNEAHSALEAKAVKLEQDLKDSRLADGSKGESLRTLGGDLAAADEALAAAKHEGAQLRAALRQKEDEFARLREECEGLKSTVARTAELKDALRAQLERENMEALSQGRLADESRRKLAKLQADAENLAKQKADTEKLLLEFKASSSEAAAEAAEKLEDGARQRALKEERLKETETRLSQTSTELAATSAAASRKEERGRRREAAAQRRRMQSVWRKCLGGGKALAKAVRTWHANALALSSEVLAVERLRRDVEVAARKTAQEAKAEKDALQREHDAVVREREVLHTATLSALSSQHRLAANQATRLEKSLAEAAHRRLLAALKRLVRVRRLRRAFHVWTSRLAALAAWDLCSRSLRASHKAQSDADREAWVEESSAVKQMHQEQQRRTARAHADALEQMDREIRTLRNDFSQAQASLTAERDESERRFASERSKAVRLGDELACRDAELTAQRQRTAEVTASVAEIQRRLNHLAASQCLNSPSKEIHRLAPNLGASFGASFAPPSAHHSAHPFANLSIAPGSAPGSAPDSAPDSSASPSAREEAQHEGRYRPELQVANFGPHVDPPRPDCLTPTSPKP